MRRETRLGLPLNSGCTSELRELLGYEPTMEVHQGLIDVEAQDLDAPLGEVRHGGIADVTGAPDGDTLVAFE